MLKVRPIKQSDLNKRFSRPISSVIRGNDKDMRYDSSPDVVSEAPYGVDRSSENPLVTNELFYKPTHIDLAIPIVNVFLAGVDLDAFTKIIPKEYCVADLAKGSAVLYIGGEYPETLHPNRISNSDLYNPYEYLIGGAAIKYLLERVDVEDAIARHLLYHCNKKFPISVRKNLPNNSVGTIVKGSGDVWIIDEYYINLCDDSLIQAMSSYADSVREMLLTADEGKGVFLPVITVLLSFRDNPDRFFDMIQKIIPILPLGFRPTIDRAKDPLSILYNRVIQSNNELKNNISISGCRLDVIRLRYANLYRNYLQLVYKKSNYDDDRFKPIIDILTGKEGIIRDDVQAAVIDFSGRSVITVDPDMPVDTIGIPEDMAIHLCELDAIKEFKTHSINKSVCLDSQYKHALAIKARKALEGSYIITGRQPTLYLLGMQAFKVKVVKGFSIVLNPIVTPAFNADFDGDQMYVNKPQTKMAQDEVKRVMANVNNIFLPRDGNCHLAPRQEMIYGLYLCFNAKAEEDSRTIHFDDDSDFKSSIIEKLKGQDVLVTDRCTVGSTSYPTVGYAALKLFLGGNGMQDIRLGVSPITKDKSIKEKCVTESWFKDLFKYVRLNYSVNTFVNLANGFVKLGFTVANLYAPDINVLENINTCGIKDEFEEKIAKREEWYNLGFDTEESYSLFYSSQYNELEKKVLQYVKGELGNDNGFIQLIDSGARGSKSNLLQLFGMKGTILKNQAEAFNAIIKTPLVEQLSGLEHFITAYGSRQGIIDKVIGTYAPGYLSRKMSHVAHHMTIVSDDCGTEDGIKLTYDFMVKMFGVENLSGEDTVDYFTIKNYTTTILEGRFIVGGGITPLTREEAEDVFSHRIAMLDNNGIVKYGGVLLRSPLTCKDQCCTKCYGIDLTTNRMAVKGTSVGFIASQSIGEPVTQLIMKNFQKGGVAGVKNLTSSFDTLSDLLEMVSVSKGDSKDEPIIHDYISPVEGYLRKKSRGDGTAELQILNDKGKNMLREKVVVYESIKLKDHVSVGESIQLEPGILDINEILKYRGIEEAKMHMLFTAYNIFVNEVFVNFKHFEVLVNGMTFYLCTKGNSYFRVGNYYSLKEYITSNKDGCEFIQVLRGLKQIPKIRNDFLTSIYLEDVNRTVTRNIITSGEDSLKDPFVRITLGLVPELGTACDSYLDTRGV